MSIAQANADHAITLCQALVAGGVRHVVVSPGSRNTPLVLAFETLRRSGQFRGLQIHVVLDERAAGFLALGIARVTGFPAVLTCTSGSACAHYLPAIIEASQSHVPMIAITADRPIELQDVGAGQTIRQPGIFGEFVRDRFHLHEPAADLSPRWLRTVAAKTLLSARNRPQGPVHINMPFREPLWEPGTQWIVSDEEDYPSRIRIGRRAESGLTPDEVEEWTTEALTSASGSSDDYEVIAARRALSTRLMERSSPQIRWLAGRIASAPHGLIVCGPMDHIDREHGERSGAKSLESIENLARLLQWPIIAEVGSGLRGPRLGDDDSDENESDTKMIVPTPIVTSYDAMLRARGFPQAYAPDMVLRIGRAPTSRTLAEWLDTVGRDRTILIDPDGKWNDPSHTADLLMVADPGELASALCRALRPLSPEVDPHWSAAWREAEEKCRTTIRETCNDEESQSEPWEGAVAWNVMTSMVDNAALHVASSMPIRDTDAFAVPRSRKQRIFFNRGANGIDGTVATALGEALGDPATPVVCLLGDLALLHDIGGLAVAGQSGARLTLVVVDNGGGGIFDNLPISNLDSTVFDRYFSTPQRVDLERMVTGVGGRYVRTRKLPDMRRELAEAIGREGLDVIVVPVDRATNMERHQRTWDAVARQLMMVATPADRIAKSDEERLAELRKQRGLDQDGLEDTVV